MLNVRDQLQAPAPDGTALENSASSQTTPSTPVRKVTTKRQFDLLKEHRSYCPYVVRSTVVPSPPTSSSNAPTAAIYGHTRSSSSLSRLNGQSGVGAVEGWRAVLTVVLRYGKGQRRSMGLEFLGPGTQNTQENDNEEPMEVDNVKAMVADVKSRGVRILLRV